ncbi:hypothetical protein EON65_22285 [archaeon]|nr:MAG: hypothetical protein EON65_22285 [archaeon]
MKRPKASFFPYAPSYYDNVGSEDSSAKESTKIDSEVEKSGTEPTEEELAPPNTEESIHVEINEKREDMNEVNNDVNVQQEVEKLSDTKDLVILPLEPSLKYIVGVHKEGPLHFSGIGKLTLLSGSLSVHGYRLRVNEKISFHTPVWQPTIRAYIPSPTPSIQSKSETNIVLTYPTNPGESINTEHLHELRQSSVTVFLLEGIRSDDQDWMAAIEDQEIYQTKPSQTGPNRQKHSINRLYHVNLVRFTSGLVGSVEETSKLPLQLSHLPKSWAASASKILVHRAASSQKDKTSGAGSGEVSFSPVRVVVCGAKGVGKSTLCR